MTFSQCFFVIYLPFYAFSLILLQSEPVTEADLHPQLNRAPSQAAESSPAKKVRAEEGNCCAGIEYKGPPLDVLQVYHFEVSTEVNVTDSQL